MGSRWFRLTLITITFAVSSCSRPTPVPIGSGYGPVTAQQLQGAHSVVATGTSGAKFTWEFTADGFEISGGGGPIPEDALITILSQGQPVEAISGQWALDDQTLKLTQITADGKDEYENVTLRLFQTPVIRVDLNSRQYVFRPLP
jgi:hypothetical protein